MYHTLRESCTLPVQNWIDLWGRYLGTQRRLSALTVSSYHSDLMEAMSFFCTHLGHALTPDDLKGLDVKDFRAFLIFETRQEKARSSIARHLSALRNFFTFLSRQNLLENTAIKAIRFSGTAKILPHPLTPEDAKVFLKTAQKIAKEPWQRARDTALYTLLYGCGLRISEALNLNIADFTVQEGLLKIHGKGNKDRFVPVLPFVQKVMSRYLAYRTEESPQAPLFIGNRGERINPAVVQRNVRQIRALLGLPDTVTPHALRHSFATHILSASGDLRAVQELLGHKSLAATQRYTDVDMAQLKQVYVQSHPRAKRK